MLVVCRPAKRPFLPGRWANLVRLPHSLVASPTHRNIERILVPTTSAGLPGSAEYENRTSPRESAPSASGHQVPEVDHRLGFAKAFRQVAHKCADLTTFAGLPAATQCAGTSLVTTAFAATTAWCPTRTPFMISVRIPGQIGHPFRFNSDSHSDSIRTPVPIESGQ